jgi:ABC-2 type transport system ATP-binding protein
LLDEPTAGLDPGQIHETREVIRSFGENHAVLLSTHILPEVTLICQRVAIINHGRLLAVDSPASLEAASEQTNNVALEVTAEAEPLRQALLALDGVNAVDMEQVPGKESLCRVDCQVDASEGIESRIARAVTARWALHRLERKHPTLENVFLRYIRDEEQHGRTVR